jgi:fatty acid desaturase
MISKQTLHSFLIAAAALSACHSSWSSVSAFNIPGRLKSSVKVTTTVPVPVSKTSTTKSAVAIPLDISPVIAEHTVQNKNKANKPRLAPEDAWIANLDYDAFARDVAELGKELRASTGDDDVRHLQKIVQWRNVAAIVGLSTVWMTPNPLTVAAISTWIYASWTMIAHHTCHGGYNRVDAGRYNSRGFALGLLNRVVDWLDWMQPEAWNVEHNRLHHYRLNEGKDPDLVQRNLYFLRDANVPLPFKYATVALFLPIWKWFYYAPNTYKELKINEWKSQGKDLPVGFDAEEAVTIVSLFDPSRIGLRQIIKPHDVLVSVLGPFMARYAAIPGALCLIPGVGPAFAGHAVINLFLAELLTNVHAFITIVTNHAGEDLYTFDDAVKPNSGPFYVRQIIGSANYDAGNDVIDFAHGFLGYQIEHHVWPDLSMLQYQRGAPRLKAICEKHGVPYVQENVFERLRKTVDIMIGKTTMRAFPTEYEPAKDKAVTVAWRSTNGAIEE